MMLAELRAAAARREAKARAALSSTVAGGDVPTAKPDAGHETNEAPAPRLAPVALGKATTTSEVNEGIQASGEASAPSVPVAQDADHPVSLQADAAARAFAVKYKNMLRVGVPLPFVLRKMGEEKFDAALLDEPVDPIALEQFYRPAFLAATQPKAPAPPRSSSNGARVLSRRKKFYFDLLPASKAALPLTARDNDVPPSLWTRAGTRPSTWRPEINARFDSVLVKQTEPTRMPSEPRATVSRLARKTSGSVLIDERRSQNIAILLVGMRLSKHEWRESVVNLRFEETYCEKLRMLLRLWPTAEEVDAIAAYDGETDALNQADAFFVELRDIPRLRDKFECLHYRALFSSRVFELRESMLLVIRAMNQLMGNDKFAASLQILFDVICHFYDGDESVETTKHARGFRVCTLTQFSRAKTLDPATSTLRLYAETLEMTRPQVADFPSELSLLSELSCVSMEGIRSELVSLEAGFHALVEESKLTESGKPSGDADPEQLEEHLAFLAATNTFAAEAELNVRVLRSSFRELEQVVRRFKHWLEEPDETPLHDIVSHIATFVSAYWVERQKLVGDANLCSCGGQTSSPPISSTSADYFSASSDHEDE